MKKEIMKYVVVAVVVAFVAYVLGGNILYWIVGAMAVRLFMPILITFFYVLLFIISVLLLFLVILIN